MSETVIKAEHLYKEYKLGVISHGTLYRDMQSWWAKVRGKEDPNSLISSHHGQGAEKDSFLALNDISFEIKEGDRVGIIGKNGAGKSTLLKILSRITSPTKGTITIKGKVGSLLEVGTGFHMELTGRENIYLNGSILGMNRHEISRKLDEIVDFAGIEKHLDTPVKRYSSGMMVRLGFAVAAHLDTDILIADEVLAVGDAEFQKKALDKMGDLSTGEGRTVLFVSHNMAAVKKLCTNGIFLERGKINFCGGIDNCIAEYNSSTLPSIPTNLKPERYYDTDETKPFQIEKIEILDKDEKQRHVYETQYEIKIRIHCVSRNPIPNMYGCFVLKKNNDQILIRCDNREDGTDIFNNLAKNKYIIELIIPAGLLSYGKYLLSLYFGSGSIDGFYIEFLEDTLEFKIIDSLTLRGNQRDALTSLVLNWNISQSIPL
jgi:lipopolysaccharide transport system ATP-binding protein